MKVLIGLSVVGIILAGIYAHHFHTHPLGIYIFFCGLGACASFIEMNQP